MISPSITIALLGLVTALVALGFGERSRTHAPKHRQRHCLVVGYGRSPLLPAWQVTPGLTIHLGALILLGIVAYLITTTSAREAARALIVGLITGTLA